LSRTSIEIREFRGKNHPKNRYLILKGHVRGIDFFKAFTATELKESCIDILGLEDTPDTRRNENANVLARKAWE
jgi:hypothetical protein